MNSVSLAYLLEIDSYMFAAFISDENKALYRKESMMAAKSIDFVEVHKAEWRLYRVGYAQCLAMIAILHSLNWFSVVDEMYDWSLWSTSVVYMLVYGFRASLIKYMHPDDAPHEAYVMSGSRCSPVLSCILGFVHFVVLALLYSPTILRPSMTVACVRAASL